MSITDLLNRHGIAHATEGKHCRPGWVNMDCPFCGPGSGKLHLGFSLQHARFSCWKCGPHRLDETLAELTGLETSVCGRLALALRSDLGTPGVDLDEVALAPARARAVLPPGRADLSRRHRDYLEARGFDPRAIAELWSVQGIKLSRQFMWRLFIPILHGGEIVSWTTRAIDDAVTQRYISAASDQEKIHHKHLLYGEWRAKRGHVAICVEGPTDVWRVGPGAVGTFGTSYTQQQVAQLAQFQVRAICFDSEPVAQSQARKLADTLSALPGRTLVIELDAPDPGSASAREIARLRRTIGLERQ
jgi:hypothetical protein